MNGINEIMEEAERIGFASYFENCLGCFTGYLSLLCFETHYDKVIKRQRCKHSYWNYSMQYDMKQWVAIIFFHQHSVWRGWLNMWMNKTLLPMYRKGWWLSTQWIEDFELYPLKYYQFMLIPLLMLYFLW